MSESKVRGPSIKYRPEIIAKMEEIAELKGISRAQAYEEAAEIYILSFMRTNTQQPKPNLRPSRSNWVSKWKGEY